MANLHNLAQLGTIKRARGYYLYNTKGQRFLDLALNNGTALLGYNPTAYGVALKNPIEQAMYSPLPNLWQERLRKALAKHFNCYVYFYLTLPDVVKNDKAINDYRPFLTTKVDKPMRLLWPEPMQLYTIVLSPNPLGDDDYIPAFLCRASLRIASRLNTITLNNKLAALFDSYPQLWQRQNIYFTGKLDDNLYSQLFTRAVSLGLLLPPANRYWGSLTMPTTEYELKSLAKVFGEFSGF
ncbi:MAG: hypothetical protein FWE37_09010 [Spirochaetaceae bacterium]|nr:hypothetical protein [Spirochaetaceae bacterium]